MLPESMVDLNDPFIRGRSYNLEIDMFKRGLNRDLDQKNNYQMPMCLIPHSGVTERRGTFKGETEIPNCLFLPSHDSVSVGRLRYVLFPGESTGGTLIMDSPKEDYHNQFPFLSHRLLTDIPTLERR